MFTLQGGRITDWLKYENKDGERYSRENWETPAGNGILITGMLLAMAGSGEVVDFGPGNANVGNGVASAVSATAGVVPGNYVVTFTGTGATAAFTVTGPASFNQTGVVGTPFAQGGLAFSIADGSTHFAVGDSFVFDVRSESGTGVPITTGYTAGVTLGIVTEPQDTTTKAKRVAVLVRDARIAASGLVYPANITVAAKAAVLTQLAAQRVYTVTEVPPLN